MGLFGKLFSKQTCGVCEKEVGALSRTKLADDNYLCNDCRKNASRLFRLRYHDLEDTKKHLVYMEKANELYEKEFATLDKSDIDHCGHHGSHKIGLADKIGMFEIVSPELKKSHKRELFRYDQIDSFGPYTEMNAMNRPEGEKRFKECGVSIKMRCRENPMQNFGDADMNDATVHPYAFELKIPLAHNVDVPVGGERILLHLNKVVGNKDYTKIADAAEKRALGKTLREFNN
ncbi:DUF4428 domain-containing protein [Candidatus Saccharibacteria bacterium]|nr:DUF4428 domain-containing protein [Candidatus Saccharibacteria bacterium]